MRADYVALAHESQVRRPIVPSSGPGSSEKPGCRRTSAWRSCTARPEGPRILSRHQPAMFWFCSARAAAASFQDRGAFYRAFPMNRSLGPLSLGHFSPILPRFFPIFSPSCPSCPQDSRNRHQDPEKRSETVAKRSRKGGLKPFHRKRRVALDRASKRRNFGRGK